jgi:uncharacterized protein
MKKEVTFYSEGSLIAADLYLPDIVRENEPLPGIVLCHGFSGIKELLLPAFAEEFVRHQFISLVFDYRGFGKSEGTRGRLVPSEQVTDIRNTLTFLQGLDQVDSNRIGVWGTSYGGAHVLTAAAMDSRIQCVVSQLPFGNGERVITGQMSVDEKEKFLHSMYRAWRKLVTKNKVLNLSPEKIIGGEEFKNFYEKALKKFPQADVKLPVTTLLKTYEYKPEESLKKVRVPLFIIAAENDTINPPGEAERLFREANDPKELQVIKGASHFDVYTGDYFNIAAGCAVEWYKKYL